MFARVCLGGDYLLWEVCTVTAEALLSGMHCAYLQYSTVQNSTQKCFSTPLLRGKKKRKRKIGWEGGVSGWTEGRDTLTNEQSLSLSLPPSFRKRDHYPEAKEGEGAAATFSKEKKTDAFLFHFRKKNMERKSHCEVKSYAKSAPQKFSTGQIQHDVYSILALHNSKCHERLTLFACVKV